MRWLPVMAKELGISISKALAFSPDWKNLTFGSTASLIEFSPYMIDASRPVEGVEFFRL